MRLARFESGAMAVVGLNLLPLVGVLLLDWNAFDLIFLYWMENLVIGGVMLARMIVRRYQHPIELVYPLLLAPFFVLHFGAFCWGHGSFLMSLFAPSDVQSLPLPEAALHVLAGPGMLAALALLAVHQLGGWFADVRRDGPGCEGVKMLMADPYRRIVILHVTILLSGFALMALDEPVVGLVVLVMIKMGSDLWHARRAADEGDGFVFTDAHLAEMQGMYPEPVVTVNGEERLFDSFADMRASSEFRFAQAILRLMGLAEELKAMNAYFDLCIERERGLDRRAVAT